MFERFSDRSRQAVVLAQEEARRLHHGQIGAEHLLLGILREGQSSAARVLKSLGVTLEAARNEVQAIDGGLPDEPSGHIPFTARAKSALELSLRESLRLGDHYITPGHLLIGLTGPDESAAAQVLDTLGINLSDLRDQMFRELSHGDSGPEFAHYVRKEEITSSRETGIPATALCGKKWLPTKDPKHYPVCPSCKNIYERLPAGYN